MQIIPFYNIDEITFKIDIEELVTKNEYDFSKHHRHNYFEVFIFEKGGGTHDIDFINHKIKDCSVQFIFPNQVHLVQRELDSYGKVIKFNQPFFLFLSKEVQGYYNSLFYKNPNIKLNQKTIKDIIVLIEKIQNELEVKKLLGGNLIVNYLSEIIIQCIREATLNQEISSNKSLDETYNLFSRFKDLAEQEFKNNYGVQYYLDTLNISDKKLSKVVKKHNGTTIGKFLSNRLTLEAKRLLVHSNESVKEIAYELNFNDPAHFNKFFKTKTGLTPLQFKSDWGKKYNSK